ncbi:MAG: hypothetical protein WB802_11960 [Candidatus Dormiibacterota bacterium]|jgi:hypothetical protein
MARSSQGRVAGRYLAQAAGAHVVHEAANLIPVGQERARRDPCHRLTQFGLEVGEGLEGERRPDARLLLDASRQLVIAEAQHDAVGVVDQQHGAGPEKALGDDPPR